jgi:N-succinyldiaminopimelate aminotransferase
MINRVRLVGAVPRLVPLRVVDGEWRLDLEALGAAPGDLTRVVFVNNASFPTGWVVSDAEWDAIAALCRARDLWLPTGAASRACSSTSGPCDTRRRCRACATGR